MVVLRKIAKEIVRRYAGVQIPYQANIIERLQLQLPAIQLRRVEELHFATAIISSKHFSVLSSISIEVFHIPLIESVIETHHLHVFQAKISDDLCLKITRFKVSDNLIIFSTQTYEKTGLFLTPENFELDDTLLFDISRISGIDISKVTERISILDIDEIGEKLIFDVPRLFTSDINELEAELTFSIPEIFDLDVSGFEKLSPIILIRSFSEFEPICPPQVFGSVNPLFSEIFIYSDIFEAIPETNLQSANFSRKTQQLRNISPRPELSQDSSPSISRIRKGASQSCKTHFENCPLR